MLARVRFVALGVSLAATAACGRWGYDVEPSDVPKCEPGPWGAPERLDLSGASGDLLGPTPSADGLTLYFTADGGTPGDGEDVYVATRARRDAAFGPARRLDAVDSDRQDGAPFPAPDGLALYFASERAGGAGGRDLWVATRASPGAPFGAPQPLADAAAGGPNTDAIEELPSVDASGTRLFFASDQGIGQAFGDHDLFEATRARPGDAFADVTRLDALSTSGRESGPRVSADGLTVYFDSDRLGGHGGEDLWVAHRASLAASFAAPENLDALNSDAVDEDPAPTADGLEIFFGSQRGGHAELWHATRACN